MSSSPLLPRPSDSARTWSETIFPMKLYDILCNPEYHHAICWMPHGRSWKVLNKDFFMEEICPQYFAQTRYESFIRQVNGWGFKRMRREGPDRSSYYHESFLRGYPNLMDHMRRPAPGEKSRDLREEPDFYAVPAMPQLPAEREVGATARIRMGAKVGRPPGSLTAMGPRSSFEPVPQRDMSYGGVASGYTTPYGGPPWNMANSPPGWTSYSNYLPPPGQYWGHPPPSPWRPGPYASYPPPIPMSWGPAGGNTSNMPLAYSYPPNMYDPNPYYAAYPGMPPLSSPQAMSGMTGPNSLRPGGDNHSSKRVKEEHEEEGDGGHGEQEQTAPEGEQNGGDSLPHERGPMRKRLHVGLPDSYYHHPPHHHPLSNGLVPVPPSMQIFYPHHRGEEMYQGSGGHESQPPSSPQQHQHQHQHSELENHLERSMEGQNGTAPFSPLRQSAQNHHERYMEEQNGGAPLSPLRQSAKIHHERSMEGQNANAPFSQLRQSAKNHHERYMEEQDGGTPLNPLRQSAQNHHVLSMEGQNANAPFSQLRQSAQNHHERYMEEQNAGAPLSPLRQSAPEATDGYQGDNFDHEDQ